MARDIELKLKITADGKVAVDQLDAVSDATKRVGDDAEQSFGRAGLSTEALTKRLISLGASAFAVERMTSALTDLVETSDEWKSLAARIENANKHISDGARRLDELSEIATKTRQDIGATTKIYLSLERASDQNNRTAEEAARIGAENLTITTALNDALRINKTDGQAAAGALRQLSQGLESGVLRGDEFNSVAEQMPALLAAVSKELGVSRGELRALAKDGQITADVVRSAVIGMSDEWRAAAEKMPATLDGALTSLSTRWQQFVGESEGVADVGTMLAETIESVAENLEEVGELAGEGALLLISAALVKGAQAAGQYATKIAASTDAEIAAARSKADLTAADLKQARSAQVAAAERARATQAALAEAQANLASTKQMAIYGAQRASAERAVTTAKEKHRVATEALRASNERYLSSMSKATAASQAAAANHSRLAIGLRNAKTAAIGLGSSLSALPYALVVSELFKIADGIGAIIDQYQLYSEIQGNVEDNERRLRSAINANIRDLTQYADTAIKSQEDLASLSAEQAEAYEQQLTNAARYWAAVETQAKKAGDAQKEATAAEQWERYTGALQGQAKAIEQIVAAGESLSPIAQGMVEQFDALTGKGKDAAASLQQVVGALKFDTTASAIVNVSAVSELITTLGTANEEAGEKIRATAEDITQGLAPALDRLSGESLRNFATEWATVLEQLEGEPIEQVGAVMDAVLGAALRRLKLDLEDIRTGTTAVGRDMVAAFEAVAISAQGEADVIAAAWQSMLSKLGSSQDIQGARDALTQLGEDGRIAMEQLVEMTEELDRAQRRLTATTGDVADAFKRMGLTSSAELRAAAEQARADFDLIRDSGVSTAEDIAAAWEVYAKKAIESGDATEQSQARQEAAALGMLDSYNELAGVASTVADQSERAATAAEQDATARERAATAANEEADAVARKKTSETTGTTLTASQAETQQSLGRRYGIEAAKAFATEIQNVRDVFGIGLSERAETSKARAAIEEQYKQAPTETVRTTTSTRSVTVKVQGPDGSEAEITGDESITLGELERAQQTAA